MLVFSLVLDGVDTPRDLPVNLSISRHVTSVMSSLSLTVYKSSHQIQRHIRREPHPSSPLAASADVPVPRRGFILINNSGVNIYPPWALYRAFYGSSIDSAETKSLCVVFLLITKVGLNENMLKSGI